MDTDQRKPHLGGFISKSSFLSLGILLISPAINVIFVLEQPNKRQRCLWAGECCPDAPSTPVIFSRFIEVSVPNPSPCT